MRKTKELEQRIVKLEVEVKKIQHGNEMVVLKEKRDKLIEYVGEVCEYGTFMRKRFTPLNFIIKDDKLFAVTKDDLIDVTNLWVFMVEKKEQAITYSDIFDTSINEEFEQKKQVIKRETSKGFDFGPDEVLQNAASIHMKNFDLDKFKKSHKRLYKMIVHIIKNGK